MEKQFQRRRQLLCLNLGSLISNYNKERKGKTKKGNNLVGMSLLHCDVLYVSLLKRKEEKLLNQHISSL